MATRFIKALGNFKLPSDIKNDIIYCQRSLRAHIKVHQMIVELFSKDKEFATVRRSCLDEIENEIFEINCEQQYLLLRMRRIIDEFFKTLQREYIQVDRIAMNDFVSRQLIPLVQDKSFICSPSTISVRLTENQLIELYLSAKNVGCVLQSGSSTAPGSAEKHSVLPEQQMSLLKPISERVAASSHTKNVPIITIPDDSPEPVVEPVAPVSSKVKQSRMNLRQALTKAAALQQQPLSSVATSVATAPATPLVVAPVTATVSKLNKIPVEVPKKSRRKSYKSDRSSSEESVVDVRIPSPPQLDAKTMPDDYNQESFLRFFNLFTKDQMQQMQQRRSKRKRRNVNKYEKSDFHYGRIDNMLASQPSVPKKRKKEFLLSPGVNRALKKKRSSDADRSNSSSPDEKIACNECMKRTGTLIQCNECRENYHKDCHKDMNIKPEVGQCPSCSRIHYNAFLEEQATKKVSSLTLQGQYRDLERKLASENYRRNKLVQESKKYKIGMANLFNIVETIKSDENDS